MSQPHLHLTVTGNAAATFAELAAMVEALAARLAEGLADQARCAWCDEPADDATGPLDDDTGMHTRCAERAPADVVDAAQARHRQPWEDIDR